jgi:hypothetical protein
MPMGQDNTTFNIDELISSYIDNQISDPELKSQIEDKLRTDEKLNAKYKSEMLTKNLLRTRFPEAPLPEETYRKVLSSIDSIISLSAGSNGYEKKAEVIVPEYPSFWQTLKEKISAPFIGIPRYAYAAATIFLIVGAFFVFNGKKTPMNPYIASGTDKSIMVQALNSFHKILDGEVIPQLSSSNAAEVEKYVSEKSNFRPYLPNIENYVLSGVVCNEYKGQKLAHIIYRSGSDDIIYIYQTPVTAVVRKDLDLPQDVHNEIVKTRYYMCDGVDETDCTMTLWIKDNVVCASMTNMPKQKMQAAFTSFYK